MWTSTLLALSALFVAPHGTPYVPPPPEGPSGPSAPTAPAPTGPAVPSGPSGNPRPATPTGAGPAGTGSAAGASTGGGASDPASWELWWQYNRDRFLELKQHVAAVEVRTGADDGDARVPGFDEAASEVVPALLEILRTERANDVTTSAMIALARLADGPLSARAAEFARACAPFAADANQEVAETAVLARGLVGDASSAFDLVELLNDTETGRRSLGGQPVPTRTRAFAAYGLGFLAARTSNTDVRKYVVHHLAGTLRSERGATSDVSVACVLGLGLAPLDWGAAGSASGVASSSRRSQIDGLLALAQDPAGDRWVRGHAATALSRLSVGADETTCRTITESLLAPLQSGAKDPDPVVQGAVIALGTVAGVEFPALDARVRAALQRVTLGADRQARAFALIASAERAVRSPEAEVAGETRAFLARRLSEGRSQERAWAGLALGILEHGRRAPEEPQAAAARTALLGALKDSASPDELGALAIACGLARATEAVPILLARLERTSAAGLQGHLAVALGLIGDDRAVAPLRTLLGTARFRPELLREVAVGLALLEDHALVPTLVETLEKASSLASQAAAAAVIGWTGDRRAVRPLLALASKRDATASARGFAIVALGRICDRDRLPWNAQVAADVNYRAATATLVSGNGTGLLEIL